MLFNSIAFCIFFPIVTTIYFILPHKMRWIHLLIASFIFYMAFLPIYVLILLFTIIVDYIAGIYIENAKSHIKKKHYLVLSVIVNIGFLCFFKYYDFFINNLNVAFSFQLPALKNLWISSTIIEYNNALNAFLNKWLNLNLGILHNIVLPIGLSFHTFQAMSYTIEVYRGHQKAEKHLGIYALYVMFYPQLVAGPIERPQNMLHQFREKYDFDYYRVVDGMKLMLFGLFKKVVIADRLALYVDSVYDHPNNHTGLTFLVATLFFAIQIYCDFSGYSQIAIGAARVMGFKLMTNFNRPYFSKNIAEFWKRWHISLSTWFADYLYISLGGNRVTVPRWFFNLFIVFIISGIWHGANWTFIAWGAINGFYLISAIIFRKWSDKLKLFSGVKKNSPALRSFQICTTFILICFSWIFFRANNISDAFLIVNKIFSFDGPVWSETPSMMLYAVFSILFLFFWELKEEYYKTSFTFFDQYKYLKYTGYALLIMLILMVGVFDGGQFIYFQF